MKSSNPWGDSGTERKKFKISSMGETLYTTRGCSEVSSPYKKRPLRVDAPDRGGYAARKLEGEGAQEAGESPARSRHCDPGANPPLGHCRRRRREGRGSGDPGARRLVFRLLLPGWGADPQRRIDGQNFREITPHPTLCAGAGLAGALFGRGFLRGELPARALSRWPAPSRRPLSLVAEP